jgi:GNAT superfamily N-acetyltransferase
MNKSAVTIRHVSAPDESRWRELWDGYNRFYGREPSEPLTLHAWSRIMDPNSPVHAIVAMNKDGKIIGIANYIIHENTTQLKPVCYLQDLFVDVQERASGVGQEMIDWLIANMKPQGWSQIYWNTKETNYRARGLYDKYTPQSGFLKYVIKDTSS